jgi:Dockerin type I domain
VNVYHTDPLNPDTDGDGYWDGTEVGLGKDPLVYCAIMRADINDDGVVNTTDLTILAQDFAQTVPPARSRVDQNADNVINTSDLVLFAGAFTHPVDECP